MGKNLSGSRLLPDLGLLRIEKLEQEEGRWTVEAVGPVQAACPGCQTVSVSRHSRYWRTFHDLPLQGITVQLRIRVSRWRCRNSRCETRFFSTALPGVAAAYQRRTSRLQSILLLVGHALGGRPAERLLDRLGLPASDDIVLRHLKQKTRGSAAAEARVIGIDDWAQSKGQSYGTLVVDLENHRVIDVLAERSTAAIAAWLAAHPTVKVITRDRNGQYAQAARRTAPQAIQVADRFHLVQNLREAVERELSLQREHLAVAFPPAPLPSGTEPKTESKAERISPPSEVCLRERDIQRQRQQYKQKLFATVQAMKASGLQVSQIAARLGLNRRRIAKWGKLKELPERSRREPRAGTLEFFREYLHQRWQQGCREGRTLLGEIRQCGYVGCYSRLAKLLAPWRQRPEAKEAEAPVPPPPLSVGASESMVAGGPSSKDAPVFPLTRQISPQVAAALLCQPRPDLTSRQGEIVDRLKRDCPGFAAMRTMALSFRAILQHGKVETLHRWLARARDSEVPALRRFAQKLQQDQPAVEAAVQEPWSNGPVEGHINRLKMLKRQMYGQAGIELLRARLLPLPGCPPLALQQK